MKKRLRSWSSSSKKPAKKRFLLQEPNCSHDRISNLPEEILHHILSYLPTKDAAKTSVLSKTWNSTWKSFPLLAFDQYAFLESPRPKRPWKQSVEDFCRYVDDSISSRRGSLHGVVKFQVVVNFSRSNKALREKLDGWLNYAIEENVQDLRLSHHTSVCMSKKDSWRYVLPQSLFHGSFLQNLDLFGCHFDSRLLRDNYGFDGFGFSSLKKLHLSHVHIDEETLESMVSRSRLLEDLTINQSEGFDTVRLTGAKLERVALYLSRNQVQIVGIDAPNLVSLTYAGGFGNVEGSWVASNGFKGCKNLKELKFHDTDITDKFLMEMELPTRLDGLKVELERCFLVKKFRVSGVN